jgi:hypothetical protein
MGPGENLPVDLRIVKPMFEDLLLMPLVRIGVVPASVRAVEKKGLVSSMLRDKENNDGS